MADLDSERARIDALDRQIVELLLARARSVHAIGELKRESTAPLYRPEREKAVYEKVRRVAASLPGGPALFSDQQLLNIYREIMSASLALEGGLKIAFLGPAGSYSSEAARNRFGSSVHAVPVESIADVFRAVESRRAAYGIVPVENSLRGSIGPSMDQFLQSELVIYAEHYERIRLHLLGLQDGPLSAIDRLYLFRETTDQCQYWLNSNLNLKNIEFIETGSTARAAERLKMEGLATGAAIASLASASIYGLTVLEQDIQDRSNNLTRFAIVGKHLANPSGKDRTSIIVALHDRPGSLFGLLSHFESAGINLSRIESRVSRKAYGDYYFYLDFEGHRQDERVKTILSGLERETPFLKILGSYPRADLPE